MPLREERPNKEASRSPCGSGYRSGAISARVCTGFVLEVSLARRPGSSGGASCRSVASGMGVLRNLGCDSPWLAGLRARTLRRSHLRYKGRQGAPKQARGEASSACIRYREIRGRGRRKVNAAGQNHCGLPADALHAGRPCRRGLRAARLRPFARRPSGLCASPATRAWLSAGASDHWLGGWLLRERR